MKPQPQHLLPPSVPADWIGGHFRSFRRDPTGFLTKLAALGDISFFRMARQPAFFVNDPEMIRDVLVVNAHKFHKGRALKRAKALLGEGLLTNEGAEHLRQRRMIQPAFHRQRIAEYARSMVEFGEKMSDEWRDGGVRDIDREMMRLTLQIVGKTLFSSDVENEADEVGQAMTTIVELFNFLLLPFSDWLRNLPLPQSKRFRNARATLDKIIYGMIADRRRTGESTGDLLSMLLDARDEDDGSPMTDEQIRDEALTLFLAGHETTANALTWTWFLLSQNPEKEAKLHAELTRVLGDRSPTIDDVPNLKFTEAALAESMRLYPPAWAIGRLAVEEDQIRGYKIPVGALLLLSPYVTHRDGRYWPQPDEFIPERWETQSIKEAGQKNIYFPFGGGVRRCIGESFAWTEGILLIATLARKWKLRLVPEQKISLQPMITLRPRFGMKMEIQSLKPAL
ncbi:MAG TPA: cytochrome P450 [Pyrinomonadaceae bacterium]|nr:cytochrome P450 [Pyrinomonadaceae bacterium]